MFFSNTKSIFLKVTEYVLYVFFILFPFVNYGLYLYSGTTTRAVNMTGMVSILAIIIGCYMFSSKVKLSIPKSPILLSLCIYFVVIFISALFGFNFYTSFWSNVTRMTGIWYLINLGFLIMFISAVCSQELRKRKLILSIVLSTTLYSVLYLFSHEGFGLIFKDYINYAFTFGNSTFAGMYLFGAFILSLYYLLSAEKKKWWMYILPILLMINPSILNTKIFFGDFSDGVLSFVGGARASSLVFFLSIFTLLFAWGISKIKNVKVRQNITIGVFTLAVLGVGFVGTSLLSPNGYVRKAYLSQATSARPLIWEVSNKVIADRPFLGWGGDNFERVFEKYYDNRELQDEYGNEAWFDRAHNVFIDQTIDAGYLGLATYVLIYLCIGICLLFVVLRSRVKNERILAVMLLVYFVMHLLELQTAFDTSVSFVMVAFMLALSIDLFHKAYKDIKKTKLEIELNEPLQYIGGALIIAFFSWTFFTGLIPFMRTQHANGYMRTIGSSEKRLQEYNTLFASQIDPSAFLWRTSADLQRGIAEDTKVLEDPAQVASLNKEFGYLELKYKEYLKNNPRDYRSHLNLADIMIYVRLFQVDKLEEAQNVLDDAITLAPQIPQAYWMKAVAYLYERKFDLAREWAEKGLALNPKIKESQNVVQYVDDSIKTFPNIDLYFFKQI
ncbi:MAG: O-antigen ligase family protein [Patescibacteria group bacterium]